MKWANEWFGIMERSTTTNDTSTPPPPRQKRKKKKSILDFMLLEDDNEKQKFLDKLHTLIDGRKGKYVAFVIRLCVEYGLMTKPKFPILEQTFGNIGNPSGFRKYYKLERHTEQEIKEIMGIETHILPFLNSI